MRKILFLLLVLSVIFTSVSSLTTTSDYLDTSLYDSDKESLDSLHVNLEDSVDKINSERERYILEIRPEVYRPAVLEELGVEIRYEYTIINGVAVEAPSNVVDVLEDLDFVENVRPDLDTRLPVVEGESSEDETESYSGGNGLVVAVLDTGIDDNHIDLQHEVTDHQDFTSTGPEDRHGHGTHVAGIASGTGEGNSEHVGIAPDSSLMNVKVLRDDGSGSSSDAIKGIEYAVENNADVIVMSLGVRTECDGRDPLSQAADNAVNEGVPVVVSAGNDGSESETITSPGCARNVFTIGASGNNNVASFSSRGPTADGRAKPDIVAPGVNIMAAEAGTRNNYISKSGTSMSAPYVGGAVILLMEQEEGQPEDYYNAISETAYTLNENRNAEGAGQINITAALNHMSESSTGERDDEDSQEDSRDRPTEEERKQAEDHEDVERIDKSPRQETRDNREYWVYRGKDQNGRHIDVRIDRESGEIVVELPKDYRFLINLLLDLQDRFQGALNNYF